MAVVTFSITSAAVIVFAWMVFVNKKIRRLEDDIETLNRTMR